MKNLGGKSEQWLDDIGIRTRADLERVGSVEIYRLLREKGYPVSINLVWAIEGALRETDWREIPESLKAEIGSAIRKL